MNERAANEGFVPLGKRRGSSFRGQRDAATDTAAELGGVSSQHFLKEQVLRGPAGTLPPRASRADLKSAQEGALYYSLRERIPVDLAATPGAGGQALRRAARAATPGGPFRATGAFFLALSTAWNGPRHRRGRGTKPSASRRRRDAAARSGSNRRRKIRRRGSGVEESRRRRCRDASVGTGAMRDGKRRPAVFGGRRPTEGRGRPRDCRKGGGDREIVGGSAVAQTAFCAGKFCLVRLRARGLRSGPS